MTFAPLVLIVRDGLGFSEIKKGNAIANAKLPNDSLYRKKYPTTLLECSGNAVGLPAGTQGGSEVGHLTIGAGRIVWQSLEMIKRAIKDNSFFSNPILLDAIQNCKKHDSALHLMGLFSDVGVHATTEHAYALLELAKKHHLKKVYIHAFLDGRDVPERSAHTYVLKTNQKIREIGVGKIASVIGRYYAMDRDKNWDRTQKAFDLLVNARGFKAESAEEAILNAYVRGDKTDYYVQPTVVVENEKLVATVQKNDSVIFYNFRSDRTRQLTSLLTGKKCPFKIDKPRMHFVCFSDYDPEFKLPIAFPQIAVTHNIGYCISHADVRQLRIAETEKYAHVTFFFNSQIEKPFSKEDRILVPSPKVPSYDVKPEMSAYEITHHLLTAMEKRDYAFVLVNFANPDLVGHSGNYKATIKCCEVVDECVGRIVKEVLKKDGVVLLTADHGNAEQMLYSNGEPCPSHTTNKVPFTVISNHITHELKDGKGLQDIAPTVLKLLGIPKPVIMTGESLI